MGSVYNIEYLCVQDTILVPEIDRRSEKDLRPEPELRPSLPPAPAPAGAGGAGGTL